MIKSFLLLMVLSQSPKDSVEFMTPDQIISIGSELEADEEYQKAVDLYLTVSENDTSYIQIQSRLMNVYNEIDEFDKSIEIGTKLKNEPSKFRSLIYNTLGNTYLKKGNVEEAKIVYQEGLKLFPYHHILIYNMGLIHLKNEEYPEAASYFQQSSRINPFYAKNHMMLGYISMLQGHTSNALLSYLTYLAINPSNNSILVFLENLSIEAVRKEGSITPFTDNSAFDYYDNLIRSKAALDSRFKSELGFNASIVKQSELLLSKLHYVENSENFWMDYYVPFYTSLHENKLSTAFIYFILKSTNNKEVLNWLDKNDKELSNWVALANSTLKQNRNTNSAEILGEKNKYSHWYYDSNELSAIGNQIDEDTRIGPWVFFTTTGSTSAIGRYNEIGKKIGNWIYYHDNGLLSREETYDNKGEISKPVKYYHENGAISIIATYQASKLEGFLEYYYNCGQIKEMVPFHEGVKTGKGKVFYETGELKTEYNIKNDTLNGVSTTYYKNGQVSGKYIYKSGDLNGKYFTYYNDGQADEIGQYEGDSLSGAWMGYHPNGNISYKGSHLNGKRIGEWEYYHSNGSIKKHITYDANGKEHGDNKYYNDQGILDKIETYKNGTFIGYTIFDTSEKKLFHAQNNKGTMELKDYYITGELKTEGTIKDEYLNGSYTTYFKNGNINQKGFMVDSDFDGDYKEYYSTGQIYTECSYKNGLLDGYYRSYYNNGTIKKEGWYVNDKPEQLWKFYLPDGSLDEDRYYISGILNGWSNSYAPNNKIHHAFKYELDLLIGLRQYDTLGTIYNETEIKLGNGLREFKTVAGKTLFKVNTQCGEYSSDLYNYYPNGHIENHFPIKNSHYNGDFVAYTLDGSPEVKGKFINDNKEGAWQWFHSNGKIANENYYIRNELNKQRKKYYYNGQLESVCNYSEDKLNGTCTYYDHTGQLQLIKIYDKEAGLSAYINIQTKDTIAFISKGAFTLNSNFTNGKIASTQSFLDGKYEGTTMYYNQDGSINESIAYKRGDNNGDWIQYYANGNVYIETPYTNDLINGIEKEYYENGKIKRITPYINDKINGTQIIYNTNGTVKSKTYFWNDYIY